MVDVCLDKKKEVQRLSAFPLSIKCLPLQVQWTVLKENRALWNLVIKGKYGDESGG